MPTKRIYIETSSEFKRICHEWRKKQKPDGSGYNLLIAKRGITNSFYIQELKTKIIDRNATKLVVNPLTEKEEFLLAGEYARKWLKKLFFPLVVDRRYNRFKQCAPMFYCGTFINRNLVYFDLIGAYHQIYSKLWLDLVEIGQRCKFPLLEIANVLANWKAARNAVIGNLASSQVCVIVGNKWDYRSVIKPGYGFYNPMILFYTNTMLQELANQALKLGCCYINCDGFIFPSEEKWREFTNILNGYGLKFRCISGEGSIYRFNSYRVEGTALYGSRTDVSTQRFFRDFHTYIDNPIMKHDKRIQRLFRQWQRPLNKVDKMPNNTIISMWSKL